VQNVTRSRSFHVFSIYMSDTCFLCIGRMHLFEVVVSPMCFQFLCRSGRPQDYILQVNLHGQKQLLRSFKHLTTFLSFIFILLINKLERHATKLCAHYRVPDSSQYYLPFEPTRQRFRGLYVPRTPIESIGRVHSSTLKGTEQSREHTFEQIAKKGGNGLQPPRPHDRRSTRVAVATILYEVRAATTHVHC
jgi:hypothetical protein